MALIALSLALNPHPAYAADPVNTGSGVTISDLTVTRPPVTDPTETTTTDPSTTPTINEEPTPAQKIVDAAAANGRYISRCPVGADCQFVHNMAADPAATMGPGAPAPVTVSIRDVATFIPRGTSLRMEPARWMLRDSPTNFIATAKEHVVSATLLGRPAEVRFTPTGYTFDYGDGTSRSTTTGGASWADLGLDEFSETATSHVYTHRGEYTVTASAIYVAEYRIDGGSWIGITGSIAIPTTHTGRAVTIDNVLVRGTCMQYPTDPGCPLWDPQPEGTE